jgi:hypothetical protein
MNVLCFLFNLNQVKHPSEQYLIMMRTSLQTINHRA